METLTEFSPACPVPLHHYPRILLAHGGGGRLMHELIDKLFVSTFQNTPLSRQHDAASFDVNTNRLAFTTDSYVVHPLFFPGGDIGSLAVHGTVNDLAVSGARPLYLSAGFILEEGLPMETLWRIVQSMKAAADHAGVTIVTGDTKVVDRGKGDGLYINTAGVGLIEHDSRISPRQVRAGDVVLVNGDIGRHGIAIMAQREGLEFESEIESDSAPLADLIHRLLAAPIDVHCMRDLTRGGLASALNEIASSADVGIQLNEDQIPVREDVQAGCEILGFDPLYVACEGRFVMFVEAKDAQTTLETLETHALGAGARIIGQVSDRNRPVVTLKSRIGARRIVDMLSGEQLPRIC